MPKFDGGDDDYAKFVVTMQLYYVGDKKDAR